MPRAGEVPSFLPSGVDGRSQLLDPQKYMWCPFFFCLPVEKMGVVAGEKETAALLAQLAHLDSIPTACNQTGQAFGRPPMSVRPFASPGPPKKHGGVKGHEGSLEVGHVFLLFTCRCILRRNLAALRKRAIQHVAIGQ